MKLLLCLLLIPIAAFAQIGTPTLGYIVDSRGDLRPVLGVEGSFTLGEALHHDVISAAFSGKTLVVKLADSILVDGQAFDAPSGSAVATFDRKGLLDTVRFEDAGVCRAFRAGAFHDVACEVQSGPEVRDRELFIDSVAVPLPAPALRVSQMAADWLVIYAEDRVLAKHGEKTYELPEVTE